MNCKKGDLARVIYVPELKGAYGHICTCVELDRHPFWGTVAWVVDPPLPNGHDCIVDSLLRPIRGQDGDDETLAWAGKPADVSTPVTA